MMVARLRIRVIWDKGVWFMRRFVQAGLALLIVGAGWTLSLAAGPGRSAEERDAGLGRALAERRQVVALPNWVRGLWVDPKGEPWFEDQALTGNPIEEARASLSAAVAGKTRVIRGGRPILRDSRGRFWVIGGGQVLLGYDGKA